MGFFFDDVDTSSELWKTCAHEGAHVVACHKFGWDIDGVEVFTPSSAVVHTDDSKARRKFKDPNVFALNTAIISLVGPVTSERLAWFSPGGCETDRNNARKAVGGTKITYGQAMTEAKILVARDWGKIKREGRKIYADWVDKIK